MLSTLHTNSAIETLIRMTHMGIEPYHIAASVTLIVAQRLVRKLCQICKQVESLPKNVLLAAGFHADELSNLKIYAARGCEQCVSGYRGRTGIYELLPMTEGMRQIILAGGMLADVTHQARREGVQFLFDSALNNVRQGVTSLEEIMRVIRSDF